MSYTPDTDVAPFCHGRNHSGIPAATVREFAPDHHRRPPGPGGTPGEFTLARTDRGVSGSTRHRGLRRKPRLGILDGDRIVLADNAFGSYARVVGARTGARCGAVGPQPTSGPAESRVVDEPDVAVPEPSGGTPGSGVPAHKFSAGIRGTREWVCAPMRPSTGVNGDRG